MELGGDNVILPDRRTELNAVVGGGGDDIVVVRLYIIGVDKVDVGIVGNAFEGWRTAFELQLVPAHLGHLQLFGGNLHILGKAQYMPRDHIQPPVEAELDAVAEEQLHADTDAQERAAIADDLEDRFDKTGLFQVTHTVAKGPHTRQNHLGCLQYNLRICCDDCLGPDLFKTLLHGTEVAHAVIYDGDHILSPQSLRSRRFCRTY